jgi:hypothetical protein
MKSVEITFVQRYEVGDAINELEGSVKEWSKGRTRNPSPITRKSLAATAFKQVFAILPLTNRALEKYLFYICVRMPSCTSPRTAFII